MRLRVVLLALCVLLGGCAGVDTLGPGTPRSGDPSVFTRRAEEVVSTWEHAGMSKIWRQGFVPLSRERLIVTGDPGFTESSKEAFAAGRFTMSAPLAPPPPYGSVAFPDGSRMRVRLVTSETAFADIAKPTGSACSAPCAPLKITQVQLGTVKVLTTRGNAAVPAWLFTVEGLRTPFAYMAVDSGDISEIPAPPAADYPALRGLASAAGLISVDGETVRFTLSVGACDTDVKPLVYETKDTVAVGGSVTTPDGVCNAMLKVQPVTVVLARPLGDRALLNGLDGRPLTVNPFL